MPSLSINIMGVELSLVKCLVALVALAAVGGGLVYYRGRPAGGPARYQGKTLAQWFELKKAHRGESIDEALEKIGPDPASIDVLLQALGDPGLKQPANYVLSKFGAKECKQVVPRLAAYVQDGNQPAAARTWAAQLLAQAGPDAGSTVPVLIQVLNNETQFSLRQEVANTLGRIGPQALPGLIETVNKGRPEARRMALAALAVMGPGAKDAVPRLIELLQDADAAVVVGSSQALAAMGGDAEPAVPHLIARYKVPGPLRDALGASLSKLPVTKKVPVTDLVELVNTGELDVQIWAAGCCAELGPGAATAAPALREKLTAARFSLTSVKAELEKEVRRMQERASARTTVIDRSATGEVVNVRQGSGGAATESDKTPALRAQVVNLERLVKGFEEALARIKA